MSNVIFPTLHNWSLVTGWCAALLIVAGGAFLLVSLMRRRNTWWQAALLLLMLALGIWSLVVAFDGYFRWLTIVQHAPMHGMIAYAHAINETYLADVHRSQIQFAVTIVPLLLLLLVIGWGIFRFCKRRIAQ